MPHQCTDQVGRSRGHRLVPQSWTGWRNPRAAALRPCKCAPPVLQADPLLHSDKIALRPLYAKAQHELFIHGQQDAPRSGSDPPAHARRFKSVDVRHISELTDSQFASEYMAANRPVLIQVSPALRTSILRPALRNPSVQPVPSRLLLETPSLTL